MQITYALFDFDGTLRSGDSIIRFCIYARQRGLCSAAHLRKGIGSALGYGLKLRTAEQAKASALSWLKGRLESEMQAFAQEFCLNILLPQMYPQGMAAIKSEQARGARVLLVTASPSFYLEPLRDMLGIDAVIGTRMNLDESCRFTGDICGDNCRGLQKPLRLAEYLAAKGQRLDYDSSAAYGDSMSDLPMLELCKTKVGVNPGRKLSRVLSKMEGGQVVHWSVPSQRAEASQTERR